MFTSRRAVGAAHSGIVAMPYYTASDGSEIFYRVNGKGPLAVFIHPIMNDGSIWLDQLLGLRDIRRCVSIDLRGHGKSDPNPRPIQPRKQFVDDVIALMDHEFKGQKADFVGLSAGGIIGGEIYEQRPDLVKSLTLVSTLFPAVDDPRQFRYRQELARLVVVENKGVVFRRWLEYDIAPHASLFAKARYRSMLERTPHETMVAFLNNPFELRPDLPAKLKLPVLVPLGGEDPLVDNKRDANLGPNFRTVHLKSAGRLAPIEAPEELNAALREFWTSLG
jgi:3-oxoadipate enol-lactonase